MAVDDMMNFRLLYLQAIARTFDEPAFLNQMLVAPDGIQFLIQNFRGTAPDWTVLVKFLPDNLPGNGFRPALTGSWVGPRARLTVYFPEPPDPSVQARALAAYYALLPSPLGQNAGVAQNARRLWIKKEFERVDSDVQGTDSDPARPLAALSRKLETVAFAATSSSGGSSAGANGDGLGHAGDALVLGAVIVRALALSWRERPFVEQLFGLTKPPMEPLTVLENWLGYKCPWNIELVATPGKAIYDVDMNEWRDLDRNLLEFFVPNVPASPSDKAIALAAYNQTGDQYPFTCP